MLKIPDTFSISVERRAGKWSAVDKKNGGAGYGKTAGEAIRNFAEGLDIANRIDQRTAMAEPAGNA